MTVRKLEYYRRNILNFGKTDTIFSQASTSLDCSFLFLNQTNLFFLNQSTGGPGGRVEQTMADFKRHQTICSPRDINKITKKKI